MFLFMLGISFESHKTEEKEQIEYMKKCGAVWRVMGIA